MSQQRTIQRSVEKSVEEVKKFAIEFQRTNGNDKQFLDFANNRFELVKTICSDLGRESLTKNQRDVLKKCGAQCWNACVNRSQNSQHTNISRWTIELRELACVLIEIGWLESDDLQNNGVKRNMRVIELSSRIGREWTQMKEYQKAENRLQTASILCDKVLPILLADKKPVSVETELNIKTVVTTWIHRIDNYLKSGEHDRALEQASSCKKIVSVMNSDLILHLALMDYNIALEMHQTQNFQSVIAWLNESLELLEQLKSREFQVDLKQHSSIFRLLSNAYLESNNIESALTCCGMANETYRCTAGLILQTKLLLLSNREEDARMSLVEMINFSETNLKTAISACQLVAELKFISCALFGYQTLVEKYSSWSNDHVHLLFCYIDLLLQQYSANTVAQAKDLIEKLLRAMHDGLDVPPEVIKDIHIVVWNFAVTRFKERDAKEGLHWFQYSLRLIPQDDNINRAKSLRFISRCYTELNKTEEAEMAAMDASKLDPKSIHTLFELFRISIGKHETKKAAEYLTQMASCEEFDFQLYSLCAQDAYDVENYDVAIQALDQLLKPDSNLDSQDKGVVLRNIVALCKKINDHEKLVHYLQITLDMLHNLGVNKVFKKSHEEEIEWFHRISWNSAIALQAKREQYHVLYHLLQCATDFYVYRHISLKVLETQRSCYLLRIYSLLQMSEESKDTSTAEPHKFLEQAVIEISKCKELWNKIVELKLRDRSDDPIGKQEKASLVKAESGNQISLLYICEFKCKVDLGYQPDELLEVFQNATSSGKVDVNAFQIMAVLSCGLDSTKYGSVGNEILRHTIELLNNTKTNTPSDLAKIISLHRLWIDTCRTMDDSAIPYHSLSEVLSRRSDQELSGPTKLVLNYLVTKAWNNGVYYYKLSRFEKAEYWMGLSVKMTHLLPTGDTVEDGMNKKLGETITNGYAKTLEFLQSN